MTRRERQQKTFEAAWPIARAIGRHMQEWHDGRGGSDGCDFKKNCWDGDSYIAVAFTEPGTIQFRLNKGADVSLTNLMPRDFKPEDIEIGPITPTGEQKIIRADIFSKNNHGMHDHQRELEYRDTSSVSTTETITNEVSVGMAMEFEQSLGYGSEVAQIQGETRFKMSFEAAFRRAWETSTTRTREFETISKSSFTEPAMHQTLYERVETVGPARQIITATGRLAFGCKVHSSGNWWKGWNTIDDFIACIQGIDNGSDDPRNWLSFYRAHPVPSSKLEEFYQPVIATVEHVREFQEAHRVEVEANFTPLTDEAKLQNALKLVAAQCGNKRLKKLALAELG